MWAAAGLVDKEMIVKLRVVGVALLSICLGLSAQAAELKLRIMETTDIHMNLMSFDYYQDKATDQYGLARTVSLIRAARQEVGNSLLFENGDLLQGNPLGEYVAKVRPLASGQTHPAIRIMNEVGYDAANIGNHDFNFGLPFLRRVMSDARFPYINANVYLDDADGKNSRHAFTPHVLLERRFRDVQGGEHTVKIGVLGLVPPQIMQWDRSNLMGKVVARDMVEVARNYVPQMRAQGADVVVVIAHSGIGRSDAEPMDENEVAALTKVPGVDAVLFGHSHGEFPGPSFASNPAVDLVRGTIHGVPAVMPGRWGDHLGVVDLLLDNAGGSWKVRDSQARIRPVYDRATRKPLVDADPVVERLIGADHAGALTYIRDKVATSSEPIYSYFAQVADDPSVQIVANAQIAYVKRAIAGTELEKYPVLSAASPFKTGGRQGWDAYTDIPAGPIAIKNVADLYVYPNTLKAVLLTGAEVQEWIEMSAGQFNRIDPQGPPQQALLNSAFPSYNFDTMDGVTYELDLTEPAKYSTAGKLLQPTANRVKNLRFDGAPINREASFLVVTNNYRAFGGGGFPNLSAARVVLDAPEETRQILAEYLTLVEFLSPGRQFSASADGNWRIRPVPGVALSFLSGQAAARYLPRHKQIRLVKDNGDGSALFELTP